MKSTFLLAGLLVASSACLIPAGARAANDYQILVSDEKSGEVTVINGADFKVTATIPVGKRPRGIHASPDGKTVYVAVSGTPIEPPPKLDANGNPIFEKGHDDDDDDNAPSRTKRPTASGSWTSRRKKFLRKIPAGSDPEHFCVSADGKRFISPMKTWARRRFSTPTPAKSVTFIPVTPRTGRRGRESRRESSSMSPAKPAAMFLPSTRRLSRSSATSRSTRVRATWIFCRTGRARSSPRNRSGN